ncbi:MAG: GHKL domain-containing protein [bacterium]|nr:GHKL domain-containing protein [bacterium]
MVKSSWTSFKRFWLEEEIPRWIGIALVTVYLCGLGAVTLVAHGQTERLALERAVAHGDHTLALLAKLLAGASGEDVSRQEALLRSYGHRVDCEGLCLSDSSGIVLASLDADEVGGPSPLGAMPGEVEEKGAVLEGGWRSGGVPLASDDGSIIRRFYRLPVAVNGAGAPLVLEAVLRWDSAGMLSAGRAWLLEVILAAVGLLGVVYHVMRRHFRGVSCIAENLVAHADRLEDELASLRVADSLGAAASSWNRLIDLVEGFRAEAQRSTATTELRQVLERSNAGELADAVDAIPDGVFIISDEEVVDHCNAVGLRLMGWSGEEGRHGRLSEADSSETGKLIVEVVDKARRSGGGFEGHSEMMECGSSHYRVRVIPQRKAGRHGACVVVVTDMSQQVTADRAREEFVSQVTHELRTPLTNIRAYTETLSSGMFDDPSVVSECYNVINKETRRLSRLVEDILSISQLEVGSIQILLDDVDVRALIQEAVRDVRAAAEEKDVDLQAVLPAKVDPIQADKDKLAVVLNNLLGNALKYTPRGGEVRVSCQANEEELLITVKDTGMGIDAEEQGHVFEKFHRSKDPDVQSITGTGIGLTSAREIARRHGGDIDLMSEKGKGSTFVVRLPKSRSGAEAGG